MKTVLTGSRDILNYYKVYLVGETLIKKREYSDED